MEYNTERNKLVIKEYGRNVQNLVAYCLTIEDKNKRTATAESIVELMGLLNPQIKTVVDYKHKLWDHLHIIADFKLDIDCPYPIPEKTSARILPSSLPYPKQKIRLRHYGKNIEHLIEKAIEIDDIEKEQALVQIIANFMKMAYKNWSNEEVNNELIKADIKTMSRGALIVSEDMEIQQVRISNNKNNNSNNNFSRNNNNRNRNGNFSRKNKNRFKKQ